MMRWWVARRGLSGLGLLAALVLVAAGCQRRGGPPAEQLAPLPPGELAVRLKVLRGDDGTALALLPVYIEGEGPFHFALDTGASHSVIDRQIADRLKLVVAGAPVETTGVAAVTEAVPVQVPKWRVGDIEMPPRIFVTLEMPEKNRRLQLQGLLGSDILSQFGSIQIDYKGQVLIFRPPQPGANPKGP